MIFWGFECSGVPKDRLLHHRMFGSWLIDRVLRLIVVGRWSLNRGTQFDFKQATGFETLSVVPMNTLLLIKEKELKAQRLQDAQRCFAAHSEGIDYTSAHLSPTKLASIGS